MKKYILFFAALFLFLASSAQKFDQLAKTPPMGWNSWNKFSCDVSESLISPGTSGVAGRILIPSTEWGEVVYDIFS